MAGGFYDVKTKSGKTIRCYLRGRHKIKEENVLTGDLVEITINDSGRGVIENIFSRENRLARPMVANVSQLITVVSAQKPRPDWNLLSRQLVTAETDNITPVICMNKTDLINTGELKELTEKLNQYPYKKIYTSALTGEGIEKLREILNNNISIFSGSSGVGKSSVINAVQPQLKLKTAEVSPKGKRGRHTTRHVELFTLDNGGMVVDSPGFSRIDFSAQDLDNIADFFPEMKDHIPRCQFRNCLHKSEPGCAVKNAVENRSVSEMRYKHYLMFLDELNRQKERT